MLLEREAESANVSASAHSYMLWAAAPALEQSRQLCLGSPRVVHVRATACFHIAPYRVYGL